MPLTHHTHHLETASTAWDGIGSAIVSGLIGGFVVFGSIWLAQKLHDRSERDSRRREAANRLLPQVMHLRDAVLNGRHRYTGTFSLWPLREQLLVNWHELSGTSAYQETERLVAACSTYRTWARADGGGVALGPDLRPDTSFDIEAEADPYLRIWSQHSEAVLDLLRGPLDDSASPPLNLQYPRLPWYMNADDIPDDDDDEHRPL